MHLESQPPPPLWRDLSVIDFLNLSFTINHSLSINHLYFDVFPIEIWPKLVQCNDGISLLFMNIFFPFALQVYTDIVRRAAEQYGPNSKQLDTALKNIDDIMQAKLLDIRSKKQVQNMKVSKFRKNMNVMALTSLHSIYHHLVWMVSTIPRKRSSKFAMCAHALRTRCSKLSCATDNVVTLNAKNQTEKQCVFAPSYERPRILGATKLYVATT